MKKRPKSEDNERDSEKMQTVRDKSAPNEREPSPYYYDDAYGYRDYSEDAADPDDEGGD